MNFQTEEFDKAYTQSADWSAEYLRTKLSESQQVFDRQKKEMREAHDLEIQKRLKTMQAQLVEKHHENIE